MLKIILLAAGVGSRLRPITDIVPKCLVPVNGIPLLNYWLHTCRQINVRPIVNTHYMSSMVESHLDNIKNKFDTEIVYESVLLNTAGTVKRNYKKIRGNRLMLVHADNLSFFNIHEFVAAHENRPGESLLTMMVFRTDSPQDCGIVEIDDRGIVQAFHEKKQNPPGNLANAAVYIMEPEIIEMINQMPGEILDFSLQVLPSLIGKISVWENKVYHRDVGNPMSLLKAQWESPCNSTDAFCENGFFSDKTELLDNLAESVKKALSLETDKNILVKDKMDNSEHIKKGEIQIIKTVPRGFCSCEIMKKTGALVYGLSLEQI